MSRPKRATFEVSPALMVELFKVGPARAFEVTRGLPVDARYIDVRYINSDGVVVIEVESETFNDMPDKAKAPVALSPPECRIVTEDELLQRLWLDGTGIRQPIGLVNADLNESEVPRAPEDIETERT